ncbi:amidohydrolase [uncultured Ilyobacter sp.]|uniref:amidohydrolase n=1 Tax=uncultured Ilyobacter sp. TaxID=544433 RepID=UPI0029C62302|nr:amidohydrolase [uncultured Ilyobacter sp.]
MLLIKNAQIITSTGKNYDKGDILIKDGKIETLGENIECVEGVEVIYADGKIITPGIIDAHCHLGMWEDAIGFEGADGNESTDPVTPHLRAIDAINPMDRNFEEAREGGITCVSTGPGSTNVIAGQYAVIKTSGICVDEMIVKAPVAIKCAFGENPKKIFGDKKQSPSTRMAIAAILRETLIKAREYKNKLDLAKKDPSKKPAFDFKMESLQPVINGEIPLKAHVHRADDILTAIRISKEFGVKMSLDHCTDGYLIVDHIKNSGCDVIVGPSFGDRPKFELKNKSFVTPGVLSNAGIKIAIVTDHPVVPLQHLPMCAALSVKAGMKEEEALNAITIYPAEILGINDRVGSIEIGKDADIVVWNGHPFEMQATVEYTLINGEIVYKK